MDVLFTKEKKWLNAWDKYILDNPKANHLIFSDWLKSYSSYGFDFELVIAIEEGKIIGGFGAIIVKALFFKFYIIPHGPIYSEGHENIMSNLFEKLKIRAKKLKCCYVQISIPLSSDKLISNYTINPNITDPKKNGFINGKLVKLIYTSYGINWVDFNAFDSPEDLLNSYTSKVRRNIRIPYNKKAEVEYIKDITGLAIGYGIIENNAEEAGYSVRAFKDIKDSLVSLLNKELAYCIIIKVNKKVKASAIFFKTNAYLTNIMGGVLREKPDIKLGYMLQWEAIKKSYELGYKGYNISMGGSNSVKEFKSRFNAQAIPFENSNYYLILRPLTFKLYLFLSKYLSTYKSKISKLLSLIRK